MVRYSGFLFTIVFWIFKVAFVIAQPPAGYYDNAVGLQGTALQSALHDIIDNHTIKSYDYLWTAFQSTDEKSDGKVWDMYSDIPDGTPLYEFTFITNQCGNYDSEGDCYNREHSFPNSWFGGVVSPMYTDLFHLYPTDGYVNNKRGNYPFGEVGTATWTSTNGSKLGLSVTTGYSGIVFEPRDDFKGDFARTYFYMATRYYGEDGSWPGSPMTTGAQPKPWALQMLIAWSDADPVSTKETDRNNAVYAIQGNRNPFIDHPEYVADIWEPGTARPEPTNYPANFSAHNIKLTWTDATGAVLPDGYLVLMNAVGFSEIATPIDGESVPDGPTARNISRGIQEVLFGNLNANATYYFKIFGYTGSESNIDYKTDGNVQQVSIEAK